MAQNPSKRIRQKKTKNEKTVDLAAADQEEEAGNQDTKMISVSVAQLWVWAGTASAKPSELGSSGNLQWAEMVLRRSNQDHLFCQNQADGRKQVVSRSAASSSSP